MRVNISGLAILASLVACCVSPGPGTADVLPTKSPLSGRTGVELARAYVGADIQIEKTIAGAVTAYAADHHKLPADIKQLVPDYLPYVPVVPGSPRASAYRYLLLDRPLQGYGSWVILDDESLDLDAAGGVKSMDDAGCGQFHNILAFWQNGAIVCVKAGGINI